VGLNLGRYEKLRPVTIEKKAQHRNKWRGKIRGSQLNQVDVERWLLKRV